MSPNIFVDFNISAIVLAFHAALPMHYFMDISARVLNWIEKRPETRPILSEIVRVKYSAILDFVL